VETRKVYLIYHYGLLLAKEFDRDHTCSYTVFQLADVHSV